MTPQESPRTHSLRIIRALTYVMFMMFAMTTDSVGVIIPEAIRQFRLTMTQGAAFHYATMTAIGVSGILFGYLADRLGHKLTILAGLVLFALNSFLFSRADSFGMFLTLLAVSGVAIGVFKTGALALVGDICVSTTDHTATMNAVEGFFGVGAIIGPAVVARLLASGIAWKWLYVIVGGLCAVLIVIAALVRYPHAPKRSSEPVDMGGTLRMMRNPFALGFSLGLFLYVAVECAIYVWMPTYFADYHGRAPFMARYAISIFFLLRAGGRFLGAWMLARFNWAAVLTVFSLLILGCFSGGLAFGVDAAVFLLPLSGLFMSVIYPTINSKGISCFPKAEHGTVAGVLLFFTCAAAALGPLAMGAVSDAFGQPRYGFVLATGFAGLLAAGLLLNWLLNPARERLKLQDGSDYAA